MMMTILRRLSPALAHPASQTNWERENVDSPWWLPGMVPQDPKGQGPKTKYQKWQRPESTIYTRSKPLYRPRTKNQRPRDQKPKEQNQRFIHVLNHFSIDQGPRTKDQRPKTKDQEVKRQRFIHVLKRFSINQGPRTKNQRPKTRK